MNQCFKVFLHFGDKVYIIPKDTTQVGNLKLISTQKHGRVFLKSK